jgi:TFIIF-interacting CTD phosphatase-like protein
LDTNIVRNKLLSKIHANAIKTNIEVSKSSHTIVDPIVLTRNFFHFIHILIFANRYELENSHAKKAIKLAITILGVSHNMF